MKGEYSKLTDSSKTKGALGVWMDFSFKKCVYVYIYIRGPLFKKKRFYLQFFFLWGLMSFSVIQMKFLCLFVYKSYIQYMYKQDLAINDLEGLIWHTTPHQPTNPSTGVPLLFEILPPQSRDVISVMYHGQVMASVLTVIRNDPATLSKNEASGKKENKETGNDHVFSISRM